MMKGNYTGGTSMATPVHVGLVSAAGRTLPIPGFKTEPIFAKLDLKTCDGGIKTQYTARTYPLDAGFCMSASTVAKVGSYYFDHWEVKRKTGSPSIYHDEGPELSRYRLYSTRSNPINEVIAHFTNTPPDFNVTNNTLSAWLAPGSSNGTPDPAVALRWRVKYDMALVQTKIEYERSPGNWVELRTSNMSLGGPTHQSINRWTGVWIFSVPGSGSSNVDIQSNREYKFRIVGYFNTIRGNESNTASITTRPAAPVDTLFCYDPNENNSESSPKVLPSSGNGASPYTVKAAAHIFGRTGEFSWHRPKADYYRLTAINLHPIGFGERVKLSLRTKPGSNFRPLFRAQRAGTSTYINSVWDNGVRTLSLGFDGEYKISVEPQIHGVHGMYDVVDRIYGTFGFGEYEILVERVTNNPLVIVTCPLCVRLQIPRPVRGWLLIDPPPPPELLLPGRSGFDKTKGFNMQLTHIPPPGFENDGFEGDPFGGPGNPLGVGIGPNTPPGEHVIDPKLKPIEPNMVELLLIHPDGPGGPLTRRTKHVIGSTTSAQATAPAGFNFVGWGYDTSASTNPLPVTMWKNKTLIAYFRPKPCIPTQMTQWQHTINVMNARQADADMVYGMDGSSTDGLDPSESDLPPVPPLGNYDTRFVNIPSAQGSLTDMRPIRQEHIYSLRVQASSATVPVKLTWGAPPPTPNAEFTMIIPGAPAPIDMRTTNSADLTDADVVYQIRIIVKAKDCPPPSKPRDVDIIPGIVDTRNFPCVDMELIVKDRETGRHLPFYNPFNLRVFEVNGMGESMPLTHRSFQMDSTIWIRLCSDDDDPDKPDRKIRVINDDDDPEKPKDTLDVDVVIPQPPGGKPVAKTTWNIPQGWDLVSVPLDVNKELASSMFTPWPSTQVFWFDPWATGYVNEDTMKFGRGYWVKSSGISVGIYGAEETIVTHTNLNGLGQPIGNGWNLIGAPSKTLSVAMIDQNPPASLLSIFGWDIATGYIVPTLIEPGRGYWVKVKENTVLKMEGTSVQGGAYFETAYTRTQKEITPVGWLEISTPLGDKRYMSFSKNALTDQQHNNLLIPPTPAADVFDIRTDGHTLFVEPGLNKLLIQGNTEATITLLHPTGAMSCTVMNEEGEVLADLNNGEDHSFTWKPEMGPTLLLKYAMRDQLPNGFQIGTAYPNPASFDDGVTIPFTVDIDRNVSLVVYDMLGREVRTLSSGLMLPGARFIQWNGVDNSGARVAPGMYLCRMTSNGQSETTTIVIAR
jgi:flagellar hook capping protein FlgD/List-Bact-rpt repeat protein